MSQGNESTTGYRRLTRDPENGALAGVAAGLADYFGTDPVLLRIGFVLLALFNGVGVLVYVVCWLVIPKRAGTAPQTGPATTPGTAARGRIVAGTVLIVIGLVVLAERLPWLYQPVVAVIESLWPLLVIAAGVAFIVSGLRGSGNG